MQNFENGRLQFWAISGGFMQSANNFSESGYLFDYSDSSYGADFTSADYGDILRGGGGDDQLTSNGGDDELYGNAGADTMYGGTGDDIIDGGADADIMEGGKGDDTFYVDSVSDTVTEVAPADDDAVAGVDTVYAAIDYTLGDYVENLILTDTAVSATGNGLDNALTGNDSANTLSGGAGIDTLLGEGGDDTLDGGADADSMAGGKGSDTYYVDNSGDSVTEVAPADDDATAGTDTVHAAVSFTLGAYVENLILTGTAVSGKGNALNNAITGNNVANSLQGLDGDDTLAGSGGNDTIFGGNGADTIDGGKGNDSIYGGAGKDTFDVGSGGDTLIFKTGDTASARADADLIEGFVGKSGDRIDLLAIDANSTKAKNQDFTFIGSDKFGGHAGELHVVQVKGDTWLEGDMDGNRKADFVLHFDGIVTLTDGFILG
jgi:Ca2+-binding RTX toxin-like protein